MKFAIREGKSLISLLWDYVIWGQWLKFGQQRTFQCQSGDKGQKKKSHPTLLSNFLAREAWTMMRKGNFLSFLNNWKTDFKSKPFHGRTEERQGEDGMWRFMYLIHAKEKVDTWIQDVGTQNVFLWHFLYSAIIQYVVCILYSTLYISVF